MAAMTKSKIGYTNDKVTWYYGWNPGGMGCSGGCECCWARKLAKRMACPICEAFGVHIHGERQAWPSSAKKAGVVLVNFTCDTWDKKRPAWEIRHMYDGARLGPQHTYVWLTQQPKRLRREAPGYAAPNWYFGLTIRTQAEADERLPVFLDMPGNKWISYEPAWEAVDFGLWKSDCDCCERRSSRWIRLHGRVRADVPKEGYVARAGIYRAESNRHGALSVQTQGGLLGIKPREYECLAAPKGIIVGHDNRRGAPGTDTLDNIRSVVRQCKAAGVPVYVKQIFLDHPEWGESLFLRASKPEEYALYPPDLQHRDLPWTMPEGATA